MTIRSALLNWLTKDATVGGRWVHSESLGIDPSARTSYKQLSAEGHNKNADVYAALSHYSTAIGGIPWLLKRRKPGAPRATWEEVTDHDFYSLWERPCPGYAQSEWIDRLVGYLFLGGEAIIYATGPTSGPNAGKPSELWLLRPDFVKIEKGDPRVEPIRRYIYKPDETKPGESIDPNRVVHIRFFNPLDELRGMSPFVAASLGIDQGNDSRSWNIKLVRKGGMPPGYFVGEETLTPEQQKDLIRQWEQRVGNAEPSGKPFFLTGGLKWVQTGMNPKDMDWTAGLLNSLRDISKVVRLAPELLGDPTAKTFANYKEARQSAYTEGFLPVMDRIRDAFVAGLLPMYRDGAQLYLDYDVSDIEALTENKNDLWARLDSAKDMTINEKRKARGLQEIDNGDVLLLSAADIPVAPEDLMMFAGGIDPTPNDPSSANEDNHV